MDNIRFAGDCIFCLREQKPNRVSQILMFIFFLTIALAFAFTEFVLKDVCFCAYASKEWLCMWEMYHLNLGTWHIFARS